MKGKNRLVLNGDTMNEAVQEYLDKRAAGHADRVIYVGYNSSDFTFTVTVEEPKEVKKP